MLTSVPLPGARNPLGATIGALSHPPRRGDGLTATGDDALITDTITQLRGTEHGAPIADFLDQHRDHIVVLSDEDADRMLGTGAGGAWLNTSRNLYMRRSQLGGIGGVTLVAHEGTHMMDDWNPAWMFARRVGGVLRAAADMVLAPVHLQNPVSAAVDSIHDHVMIENEVHAYHVQAQVAGELGVVIAGGYDIQHEDGSPQSDEHIAAWLNSMPMYRLQPLMRPVIGAGFAWIGARAGAQLTLAAAKRLAPESWVATHSGPVKLAFMGAMAASLAADYLMHKDDGGTNGPPVP